RQAEMLGAGVELANSSVSYTFTGLNALKPAMIAEATRNARTSAEEFARDSGAAVGRIKTASQGYFSVGARDGEDCDDCGSTGGSTPFQKVRVVTSIQYDIG
ncbi:MAG: SIMPL domain-containing protein, partial [Methylobacillus glycogenes]|nr:SIMPL domain-containing protein [Methylobacillus glycogenes]